MTNPLFGLDTGPTINNTLVENALAQHEELLSQWADLNMMQICINDGMVVSMTIDGCLAAPMNLPADAALAAIGVRATQLAIQIKELGMKIAQGQALLT